MRVVGSVGEQIFQIFDVLFDSRRHMTIRPVNFDIFSVASMEFVPALVRENIEIQVIKILGDEVRLLFEASQSPRLFWASHPQC